MNKEIALGLMIGYLVGAITSLLIIISLTN